MFHHIKALDLPANVVVNFELLYRTPHGAGIAWMLIENIKILGKRNNIEITVYSGKADDADKYYYYMLFDLKR